MNSVAVSSITFCLIFGGALVGMFLRNALPKDHLSADSKDVVKLGMGLVGTMTALVLGLLVASAKESYDAQGNALTQMSAKVVSLDRVLAHFGPETKESRQLLRGDVVHILDRLWPQKDSQKVELDPTPGLSGALYDKIQELPAKEDRQRLLQSYALSLATDLGQARWLMFEESTTSVSKPLVIAVVFWLASIFLSWGLFAPANGTVVATLFIAAISVSAAILLVLEMYTPYSGIIRISSAPLHAALASLGQ